MTESPELTGAANPDAMCYLCREPLAGACRICGRCFCPRHGSVRECLCRKHKRITIAAWAAAFAVGFAVYWFYFRR